MIATRLSSTQDFAPILSNSSSLEAIPSIMESATTTSFKVKFDQIIDSLHHDLDVRAQELFQLHVSELEKVASDLASGSANQNRPADNPRMTTGPEVAVSQESNSGVRPMIGQQMEDNISAPVQGIDSVSYICMIFY